jgi:uncharacterized protein YndB with AHSA1/START domain
LATYAQTVEIRRSVNEVFDYLTDAANYPRWQPSLVEVRPRSQLRLKVGSEVTEVRRFLGREMETTWTCTEHDPCTRSTIETDDGPVPFRGTFLLEPAAEGTRFTWTVEVRGAATRLGGALVGRAVRRELQANSKRLKELLEGGP